MPLASCFRMYKDLMGCSDARRGITGTSSCARSQSPAWEQAN